MKHIILFLCLSVCLLIPACAPVDNSPINGKIMEVYREIRIGTTNGTTVVELPDGRRVKFYGRLGKKGDIINVRGQVSTIK
jgi:hypothetical protein